MTTTFNFSQNMPSINRQVPENTRLYLLMFLIGLLTLFFAFWAPAGDPAYTKPTPQGNEVTTTNKVEKADAATMYRTIVTNGDAIRSVLQ
ncbi:MAG: hypothetical protein ACXWWC_05785 [Chitinophagaceae bacterium]